MIVSVITFGQEKKDFKDEIKGVKVTPPRFAGVVKSVSALQKGQFESITDYMERNVEYPQKSAKSFEQGTAVVQFTVSATGEISDFTVINSVSEEIDEEVIKVLKTTEGMWIPGVNNGNPVAMEKEVSVVFRLKDSKFSFNDLGKTYFSNGAKMLFTQQSPKKALKYFDKGITLLPNETGLLALRGMTRFELGDKDGALRDWTRIKNLGGLEGVGYTEQIIDMKGYAEMNRVLGK